jgi:hypothetical protein
VVDVRILGSDETVDLNGCTPAGLGGATVYRTPDGRWLLPAFAETAVDAGIRDLPDPDDDEFAELVLDWVEAVRSRDWSPYRGAPLDGGEEDWVDLRTAMVRVGWGPDSAMDAFRLSRRRPYSPSLPTAAGWAGAGWVVPAGNEAIDPVFARPVLEARGLQRWAYITRWQAPPELPDGAPPEDAEPTGLWGDVLSRMRQDHHTETSLEEAEQLAVEVLVRVGLGPRTAIEAEDEPLADRDLAPTCTHTSPLVRAAAWFLLRAESDAWLACTYSECQHHWAVEAEEDAYELDEVLELAGHGVINPVDAARTRRRLLTLAFGDISDVPLAGAGDLDDFLAFYRGWVEHGRPEEALEDAARELRGDEAT